MLYLAIPAQNEAATIGVLLWRLRTVLAEFPREYEAVVYDDASSDSTSEILESYTKVMPLTVLRGEKPIGYAGAINALARHVSRQTRYPRRDAMLLLQGDFTDPPALVPEFVKRFEGGADVVVGERSSASLKAAPVPVRRLQRATAWMMRLLVRAEGVRDLTSSYRLVRISVLRDLLRNVGDGPVCTGDSQSANADFLLHLIPLARRIETLEVAPTWGVRLRDTRRVAMRDGMALARWAWKARGRRAMASTAPESATESARPSRPSRHDRDNSNVLPFEAVESPRGHHARGTTGAGVSGSTRKARTPRQPSSVREPDVGTDSKVRIADASPVEPRTPRRKRNRGTRREIAGVDGTSIEATPAETVLPENPPETVVRKKSARPRPDLALELPAERTLSIADDLSPALNEAVEEAEATFEGEAGRRPPRKRRRRRGARGRGQVGSEGESGAGDDQEPAEGDAPDATASDDSPYADAPASSDAPMEGDGEGSTDGDEPRARRRGRRGRRGGARRRGASRGEGSDQSPGEHTGDVDAGPPAEFGGPEGQ